MGSNMVQTFKKVKANTHDGQFLYCGRWVNKENFRAYVYGGKGEKKLANSYKDFEALIASGEWFTSKPVKDAPQKRKQRDGSTDR